MFKKKYDIGIIGDICGVDLTMAEGLTRQGLSVIVFRIGSCSTKAQTLGTDALDAFHTHFKSDNIVYIQGPLEFIRHAFTCSVIISFTAAILAGLGKMYPLKFLPMFPKVINISTGSDIAELLAQKSRLAKHYIHHLNTSDLNWMVEYPHALKNLIRHKIKNVHLWPFPGMYVCETPFPAPPYREDILFFHPTRQDFKINDPGAHRYSSKGNNRFLKAFIRAVKTGLNARCVILIHGPDAQEALTIIHESGIEDRFEIHGRLSRNALFEQYIRADVTVDQFDIGGLGCTTVEALSGGRPVICFINEECSSLQFGRDLPPVFNCWSEEEIYEQIIRCGDKDLLDKQGKLSREWTLRHIHCSIILKRLIFHIGLMLGKPIKDYGWETSAYTDSEEQP